MLNVIEIFKSIQGEGPYVGMPATFIRLAGCPVKCEWCDTNYTDGVKRMEEADIIGAVSELGEGMVVFTGGEPLIQSIGILAHYFEFHMAREVHIETSGAMEGLIAPPPSAKIVCSPKTEVLSPSVKNAVAWKYVVGLDMTIMEEDGLPMGLARPLNDAPIYIQPLWDDDIVERHANSMLAVDIVQKHGYRLSLQIHKYLGIE